MLEIGSATCSRRARATHPAPSPSVLVGLVSTASTPLRYNDDEKSVIRSFGLCNLFNDNFAQINVIQQRRASRHDRSPLARPVARVHQLLYTLHPAEGPT